MNLQFDQTFHELLVGSYQRFVGQSLLPRGLKAEESARWLYADAAFAVLAHNTAPDPIFTYGNLAAQRLFAYSWDELIGLPGCPLVYRPKHLNARNAKDFWSV
jgi:hypothetical protein